MLKLDQVYEVVMYKVEHVHSSNVQFSCVQYEVVNVQSSCVQ